MLRRWISVGERGWKQVMEGEVTKSHYKTAKNEKCGDLSFFGKVDGWLVRKNTKFTLIKLSVRYPSNIKMNYAVR